MSILSGMGGGSGSSYKPAKAPKPPTRQDDRVEDVALRKLRRLGRTDSTAKALLGGSAPPPTKSYAMQLFNSGGM